MHFCLVAEQRKTEEQDFQFWPCKEWNESQEWRGKGEGKEWNGCRQIPGFWKSRHQWTGRLIGSASRTLLTLFCRSMFCFKILIGHYAHINFLPLVFILEHFLWPLLECNPLLEIKGFRLFNFFLQSASWIWITKQNFLLSENAMVSCNVLSCWAQLISVFLWDGKFSPIVIYRSKFQRIDWTLNSSYGELHCDAFKIVIAWQQLLN